MHKRNSIEAIMGAVVLAIASIFLIFAYSKSEIQTEDGYFLKAKFDRVDGLTPGSDVRMAGVKVGSVLEMTIDPQTYLAEVTFTINEEVKLPKDTSAEVVSPGLLANKYLGLVAGADEIMLAAGEEIVHTQSSVSLESMIGQLIFSLKKQDDKEIN